MNLTSSNPFWSVRNGLPASFPSLRRDMSCEVVVIGGGITGALVAIHLVDAGIKTLLIDKRDIGTGSTSASTALLQYEIDVPLRELIRRVGPEGKVIAEDIFDDFLAAAKQRVEKAKLANVTFVKGTETDPKLPEGTLDVAMALDVYHHFDYPEKMLAALHKSLKPDGRLVIVEYYKRQEAMPGGRALTHIRLDMPDVIKEIEANRFHLVSEKEHIPNSQYMLVFTRK